MIFLLPAAPTFTDHWPHGGGGLYETTCTTCGAHCYAIPTYVNDQQCADCVRRKYGARAPVRPTRKRYLRFAGCDGAAGTLSRQPESQIAPTPTKWNYRVLTRMYCEDATHDHATGAAQMASRALAAGGVVQSTYALAEDLSDGTGGLVATCAVRARVPGRGAGYAIWTNGRFTSAVWLALAGDLGVFRLCNMGEFAALLAGEPLPERRQAEVGECPRACGRSVRFTLAGTPYKHTKLDAKEECQ